MTPDEAQVMIERTEKKKKQQIQLPGRNEMFSRYN
jgi:hypothetical protein